MRHFFNFYAHQYNQVEKGKLIQPEAEKTFKKPTSADARRQANKHPYLIQVFRTKLQNKEKEKTALSKKIRRLLLEKHEHLTLTAEYQQEAELSMQFQLGFSSNPDVSLS